MKALKLRLSSAGEELPCRDWEQPRLSTAGTLRLLGQPSAEMCSAFNSTPCVCTKAVQRQLVWVWGNSVTIFLQREPFSRGTGQISLCYQHNRGVQRSSQTSPHLLTFTLKSKPDKEGVWATSGPYSIPSAGPVLRGTLAHKAHSSVPPSCIGSLCSVSCSYISACWLLSPSSEGVQKHLQAPS